jgi:hypothetical protein
MGVSLEMLRKSLTRLRRQRKQLIRRNRNDVDPLTHRFGPYEIRKYPFRGKYGLGKELVLTFGALK